MKISNLIAGFTVCLSTVALSGCVVGSSSPPPAVRTGSITVDVTIEESNDPAECSFAGIDRIEVDLFDAGGGLVTSLTTPCETFGITIDDLDEGPYETQILLLDVAGHQVSDIVDHPNSDVVGGTDLVLSVDFPASSLF